jgi:hypothetical protein
MSEILQANIFFMITAVAVVTVTIFVAIALYHVIRILRAVRDIVERVREGSEVIADDVANMREGFVSGRFFRSVVDRAQEATGFGKRRAPRRSKKHEQVDESEGAPDDGSMDNDTH